MPLIFDNAHTIDWLGTRVMDEGTNEKLSGSGRGSGRVTRTVLCRWADRVALVQALLGGAYYVGGVLKFTAAYHHPVYAWLYCTDVEIDGVAGGTGLVNDARGWVAYDYARLTVEFTQTDTDYGDDCLDFSGRVITAPVGAFTRSDGKALDTSERPGLFFPRGTFTRTKNNLAEIPLAAIFGLLGCVNDAVFLGIASEHVLFVGGRSSRKFTALGSPNWSLTLAFGLEPNGWNRFLMADGTWNRIVLAGSSTPAYQAADLKLLGVGK